MKKLYPIFTLILVLFTFHSKEVKAQDPQFSQFYAAPMYLNAGYTGVTREHRFIANYRIQWPALPKAFTTYAFSYDYNLKQLNSGIGLMAYTDQAGSADFRNTSVVLSYSYKVRFKKGWIFSPGLQFGYNQRSLNFNALLFGDQIDFGSPDIPTFDPIANNFKNTGYIDINTGLLAYNSRFWFGMTAHHLNKPNGSLIDDVSIVPIKLSVHGGARFALAGGDDFASRDRLSSIAPSFIYKRQGRFDQLDLGLHFHYNPIMAGVWYRGIPVTQNVADNLSRDAVSLLFGLRFRQVDIGYSYDVTVSELGPKTGGAHEISLTYIFYNPSKKKVKPQKFIPCPTY